MADDARVVAWAEHLRGGGTTPWLAWRATQPAPPEGSPEGSPDSERGSLPVLGATQLELSRRLALVAAGAAGTPAFADLAARAQHRAGPGRGLAEQPLVGARAPDYGPRPVDPATLAAEELLRPAVGLLADLVRGWTPPEPKPVAEPGLFASLRHRSYRLFGSPELVRGARRSMLAAGRPEGGRRPRVVMLLQPVETMLADVWTTRVLHGSDAAWGAWARSWTPSGLPPVLDVDRLAAHWGGARRAGRFDVVVALDAGQARDCLARLLGVPRRRVAVPATATPSEVDLLRRVNRVLRLAPGQVPEHRRRLEALGVLLLGRTDDRATATPAALGLGVPPIARARTQRVARVLASRLETGGYAVHGRPEDLAATAVGASEPDPDRTLQVALAACLSLAGCR